MYVYIYSNKATYINKNSAGFQLFTQPKRSGN